MDILPIIKDVLLVVATILVTTFATTKMKERGERKKVYGGFLQEVKQNIYLAKHNIEAQYAPLGTLFFRDDFWNMSKASGHFLDLPSNLQVLLYETYMKQYEINLDLTHVGKAYTLKPIQEKIMKELQPKLNSAKETKHLNKLLILSLVHLLPETRGILPIVSRRL